MQCIWYCSIKQLLTNFVIIIFIIIIILFLLVVVLLLLILFLGEMQRIAFRLMLSSCVCVSVCMPRLWTPGKRFEIETSFFLNYTE